MKLTIERAPLADALATCASIVDKRFTIPILGNIRLIAKDNRLSLMTHNLDASVETAVAAEVETEGTCSVPADLLNRLVKAMPTGAHIRLKLEARGLVITSSQGEYNLPILPVSDMPEPLRPKEPVSINISKESAALVFGRPAPVMCTETTRGYLCGVYLHVRDSSVAGCATDGMVMVCATSKLIWPNGIPVIVPDYAVSKIIALIDDEKVATLSWSENVVSLDTGDTVFSARLVDGTFPNYERVFPPVSGRTLELDRLEFVNAVERMKLFGRPEIEMLWEDDPAEVTLSLTGTGDGAAATERIACQANTKTGGMCFVLSQLQEMLSVIEGETFTIQVPEQEGVTGAFNIIDSADTSLRIVGMSVTRRGISMAA